ncbi:hypothetical protein A1Q2_07068 [Trichosporon asahii var. asahii CBS 8904]|uniref:Arf-GAP domain-containing protein n=1 Tax=Trichosporon asahii var. asahii (strain CBS 8904) TaxID=1220162 RepID=K1VHS3_TRIAC|nr:hypothetical protein A1Q2_07068 [Trichosporon asahii var. asahii CBS 8904]
MGTHISKVKSIDLDMWTPEQMENIQKWGNKRANAYWERHLKPGHIPPEQSKYESRRWAMEGPLPRDPSVLDGGAAPTATQTSAPAAPQSTSPPPQQHHQQQRQAHPLLSRQQKSSPAPASAPAAAPAPAPIVDIFGDSQPTSAPAPAQTAPAQQQQQQPAANMFDLDFRPPSNPRPQSNKDDIMSLFNKPTPTASAPIGGGFFAATTQSPPPQAANPYASWNGGITSSAPPQPQVMNTAPVPTWEANPWAQPAPQPQQQQSLAPKKDDRDPFANLWD